MLPCRAQSSSEWQMFNNALQDPRKLFWHDDQSPIRTEGVRQRSPHPLWHLGPRGWSRSWKRLIVLSDYMTWPRPQQYLFACILFCLPVWHDKDHNETCLHILLCLQNQHPVRMKILSGLIKYAHNTYDERTQKIPSEDTLFYFRKRRRTAVSMTANNGVWWVRAHTLWLMTEWLALEIILIVVVPVLFLENLPFLQLTTDLHANYY